MDRKKVFLKYLTPFIIFVFLSLAFFNLSFAQEKLNLTGIIRAIDATSGIVRIQVTSERCEGLWNFKFPDYAKDDLDKSMVGKRIQFSIDSPVCDPKRLHTIVLER
ncbi:MAG TPA: hypothetical protein PK864_10020 [Syntrophorhabdaceae bacterium]|nr:hypothetical protein [Syntrophorhabdaceae bacterium]HOT43051.1 hypothetical protein [Syntrophorhabdaceae bacterium]HPP42914.1 hypothetical protein [Syntrophorhabdaceae bacterium]HQE81083.1 hypothetical protein [Syntrophorhabdaceae bacterium]HQH43236.1 hypothetical protein [Syntrophorhabdaceae bacterium]